MSVVFRQDCLGRNRVKYRRGWLEKVFISEDDELIVELERDYLEVSMRSVVYGGMEREKVAKKGDG